MPVSLRMPVVAMTLGALCLAACSVEPDADVGPEGDSPVASASSALVVYQPETGHGPFTGRYEDWPFGPDPLPDDCYEKPDCRDYSKISALIRTTHPGPDDRCEHYTRGDCSRIRAGFSERGLISWSARQELESHFAYPVLAADGSLSVCGCGLSLISAARDGEHTVAISVAPRTLAQPVSYRGQSFETEYLVTYDFPCEKPGGFTGKGAGVAAGGHAELFTAGARGATLPTIKGSQDLAVVSDLRATYVLPPVGAAHSRFSGAFRANQAPVGACELVIKSVVVSPSSMTVQQWTIEAEYEARLLESKLENYRLLEDYRDVASFDRQHIDAVLEQLEDQIKASTTDEERLPWVALRGSLLDLRNNQPTGMSATDLSEGLVKLAGNSRADLLKEMDHARAIVARAEQWKQAVDASLASVLAKAGAH